MLPTWISELSIATHFLVNTSLSHTYRPTQPHGSRQDNCRPSRCDGMLGRQSVLETGICSRLTKSKAGPVPATGHNAKSPLDSRSCCKAPAGFCCRPGSFHAISHPSALGLAPETTTAFGYLEAGDQASFPNFSQISPDFHNWKIPLWKQLPGSGCLPSGGRFISDALNRPAKPRHFPDPPSHRADLQFIRACLERRHPSTTADFTIN